jgi:hypothetical protein
LWSKAIVPLEFTWQLVAIESRRTKRALNRMRSIRSVEVDVAKPKLYSWMSRLLEAESHSKSTSMFSRPHVVEAQALPPTGFDDIDIHQLDFFGRIIEAAVPLGDESDPASHDAKAGPGQRVAGGTRRVAERESAERSLALLNGQFTNRGWPVVVEVDPRAAYLLKVASNGL